MQFALTAKLLINMHDLNNERAEEIRRIPLIFQTKDGYRLVSEAVAVSGVMLKHWHAVYLARIAKKLGVKLCPLCERGESIRVPPPDAVTQEWLHIDNEKAFEEYVKCLEGSEEDLIRYCVGEDLHGFLRTKPIMLRREALIKFSWLLPIHVENIEEISPFRVVQHTRNIREVPEKPEELKRMQMPYPRSYADGVYGLTSLCDLDLVGFAFTSRKLVLDNDERKKRQRAALEAYIPMLTGAFGASLARALPAAKPLEVVAIVSKEARALPAPVHPMYEDYFQLNEKLFKNLAKEFGVDLAIYAYGVGERKEEGKFKVVTVGDPAEAIVKAIEHLGLSGA